MCSGVVTHGSTSSAISASSRMSKRLGHVRVEPLERLGREVRGRAAAEMELDDPPVAARQRLRREVDLGE